MTLLSATRYDLFPQFLSALALSVFLVATVIGSSPSYAADTVGERFRSFRREALGEGIPESLIDTALQDLTIDSSVLRNSRNQPEFTMKYPEYRGYFVTDEMVRRGVQALRRNRDLLVSLEERYGVPAEVLVAIWGVESRYGRHESKYDVLRSIYTMAFGRSDRSEYFEGELLAVLRILHRDLIPRDRLKGSWAGAMGQPQFMPSSFLTYAVDQDGDGRTNLWTSEADILASIANFLAEHGWSAEKGWGRKLDDGTDVSEGNRVFSPEGTDRRFVRTSNFEVLMRYNQSEHYALAVGELSDRIEREARAKSVD